jgi:RNA polymerase sigma factor (sigma-70 family)
MKLQREPDRFPSLTSQGADSTPEQRHGQADGQLNQWLDTLSIPHTVPLDSIDARELSDEGRSVERTEQKMAIAEALAQLTPLERVAIKRQYWLGQTQAEIAHDMYRSQPTISRLLQSAHENLKRIMSTPSVADHNTWLRSVEADINSRPHYAQTRYR